MIEIADGVLGSASVSEVAAARLAIDTRRWLASRLLPERFGDHIEVLGDGTARRVEMEIFRWRKIASQTGQKRPGSGFAGSKRPPTA
jgi:hypothetical protein